LSDTNGTPTRQGPDYVELLNLNASMGEELAATRKALAREHAQAQRLKRQLEDERNEGVDVKVVMTCLRYWIKVTGQPARTRIDLTTKRAQRTRWALKHWEPREVCLMFRGVLRDRWYVERGLTDIKHILKDEERAEHFLRLGRGGEG
jgi:hypothetical protein